MHISAYFRNRLHAPLQHTIQSWGSVNEATGDVFLRVGQWAVNDYDDGNTWVTLYHPEWRATKHGPSQRSEHIRLIEQGAIAYAVVVAFNRHGKIRAFDDHVLLKLGKPEHEDGFIYSKVLGELTIDELRLQVRSSNPAVDDIVELTNINRPETETKRLMAARIGQGIFRSHVLRLWDYRCALTLTTVSSVIRASHIKPWKVSSNKERLDPFNGLPLTATLDALFDDGLVSFKDDGEMIISEQLSAGERKLLGIRSDQSAGKIAAKTIKYLEYHRQHVFRDRIDFK
ncbi:HNH endonuclease [Mariniblastus fucicola]|uniref:HNH nuclease domain-containing protein n=1 Tax=Mariniblastus fucicola TaxID=980251 RepID=A0A5B9PJD5_9BACT|nr:HNH endonuclease [Mariniblastus fucicola]QEG24766.1 hypothetical protein MFFC18_46890 [Mariniblastus fucicola]